MISLKKTLIPIRMNVPLDDIFEEMRNKHRSRVPKNHPISNVIGNINERVVTRRQWKLNGMGLVWHTS